MTHAPEHPNAMRVDFGDETFFGVAIPVGRENEMQIVECPELGVHFQLRRPTVEEARFDKTWIA